MSKQKVYFEDDKEIVIYLKEILIRKRNNGDFAGRSSLLSLIEI